MEKWDTSGDPSPLEAELTMPKERFSKQVERNQDTLCLLYTLKTPGRNIRRELPDIILGSYFPRFIPKAEIIMRQASAKQRKSTE